MTDLPPHVGRETDDETGYALVCNAVPDGDPHTDPLCGRPAVQHFRWEDATTENGFACPEHVDFALGFHPYDHHDVTGSACGIPGACWIDSDPSYCTMFALDEEPERAGMALIGDTT